MCERLPILEDVVVAPELPVIVGKLSVSQTIEEALKITLDAMAFISTNPEHVSLVHSSVWSKIGEPTGLLPISVAFRDGIGGPVTRTSVAIARFNQDKPSRPPINLILSRFVVDTVENASDIFSLYPSDPVTGNEAIATHCSSEYRYGLLTIGTESEEGVEYVRSFAEVALNIIQPIMGTYDFNR